MKLETTTDQVANHIKTAILAGEFLPGSRLLEADICKWLEISRTPIREAFRILEAERLVEIMPNKGVYVRQITVEELGEISELRTLLEVYCIRKFISLMNEDNLCEMEGILKKMVNLVNQQDYSSYYDVAIDFHGYYVSKCRNKLLYSVFSHIRNSIRSTQFVLFDSMEYRDRSLEEHKEIMEALRERDPDKCEELLRKHLDAGNRKKKQLLGILVE